MIWGTLELQWLSFCGSSISFAVNWFLQSTLLIGAGLLAAWLFRARGSAFQSVVYRTTLFAVLLGPVVSLAMAYCGLEGWSMKLPPAFSLNAINDADDVQVALQKDADQTAWKFEVRPEMREECLFFVAPQLDRTLGSGSGIGWLESSSQDMKDSKAGLAVVSNDSQNPVVVGGNRIFKSTMSAKAGARVLKIHWFGMFAIGFSSLWVVIAGERTIRLAVVIIRMNRLRNCSIAASADEIELCQRIAAEMSLAAPLVLRAPFLTSPCLHGIKRPAVMLPEEVAIPLQEIFVHELAHLRRHDCFWLLLQQIATSVFFFHPLLYWLGRRIDATAEEVCDDVVVQLGGNRESYASSLVDLAALSTCPIAIAGVGMVSLRSLLGQRVGRIMDTSRSLSTRVGGLPLVFVISGGLAAILIGGFVGLSSNSSATAQDPPKAKTQTKPEVADQGSSKSDASGRPSGAPIKEPTVTGLVRDSDDKPVSDAHVTIVAWSMNTDVIAKAATAIDGTFTLDLKGVSSDSYIRTLFIRKEGFGVAWKRMDRDFIGDLKTTHLLREGIITARMVDIDGQPVVGLDIQPASVVAPIEERSFGDTASVWHDKALATTTDADGRFTIGGVSQGHGVHLYVKGNDHVAPQMVVINTSEPEQLAGTFRAIACNLKPGEVSVITLAPAKIFEGTIRYADTREPIPNTKVSIWSSQDNRGRMKNADGHTDQNGRYRISAYPGLRFGIQAFAPKGAPYLNRNTPFLNGIEWKAGDRVREFDFELRRGVLVRGTITEKDSKIPVADAYVQYTPESANNEYESYDMLEGWQPYELSDKDGKFEIPVLPGFGRVLISTPGQNHIYKIIGSRNLFSNQDGGTRNYVHAFERIEPRMNSDPLELQISVERGKRISGNIVNLEGTAPKEVIVVSILNISQYSLEWGDGGTDLIFNGRFDLGALAAGVEYKIHFLDAENKLGTTAILTSASDNPTITLEPCGSATLRFVHEDGQPILTSVHADLCLVMTPGANPYDKKSWESGEFTEELVRDVGIRDDSIDADGRITYSALIPGANYELRIGAATVKSFVVKSGETVDLGEFPVLWKK